MNDDYLESLLRAAGRTAGPYASVPPGLAQRVRRLCRRRQRQRLMVAGAAFLLLGAMLARELPVGPGGNPAGPARTSPPVSKTDRVPTNDEPRVARSEIEREEWIVERLLAAERIDQLAEKVREEEANGDHYDAAGGQLDRVAVAVLLKGDRRAKRPSGAERAREDYLLVTELFPRTAWADEAQRRLNTLNQ
jgi:hypothetical protein